MEPLGADLSAMFPFRDREACDAARAVTREQIARREPHHHSQFTIRVIESSAELYAAMAEDMLRRIVLAAEEGRPFVGVFPVGPVGQYRPLAESILQRGVRLEHCRLFFLDEYAHEDGAVIDPTSPWSFENIARGHLLEHVRSAGLGPEQVRFPGPDNIAHYDEMILEASGGRGADAVYGGIGWAGHFAFWDPHLWDEFADEDSWLRAHAAFVRLHPMTILQNSLRGGGDWTSVLPCAYTVGPAAILGAQHRSFWLDASLGPGICWQRFIGRLATHGPVTPLVPASYLQTAPGEVVFLGAVADDIGGPRTSWQ